MGGILLNTNTIHKGMIKIGITPYPMFPCKNVHTLIRLNGGSTIAFNGGNVRIMKGCSIVMSYGSRMELGEDVLINQNALLYCGYRINIGSHIRIGWSVQIYDTPIHFTINITNGEIHNPCKPISIQDNVWIANHATIAPGAHIPAFTTVASHSLVNKDFTTDCTIGGILMGIPAKYKAVGKVRLFNDVIE